MLIGYARISTDTQVLDQQVDALLKFGIQLHDIYKEQISTRIIDRPIFNNVLKFLRKNDTLVVCKLDRLGRSVEELIRLINLFHQKEINFISISDKIDTTTATGKLYFHIVASFAEFERNIISDRTREALAALKKRGIKLGRPFMLNNSQKEIIDRLLAEGKAKLEISRIIGIKSTTPIYNYLRNKK
jgi:DNA invertase Pin-like site-specific DNA recombinase